MPRKPKVEKQTLAVIVNNMPVTVTLHPPTSTRKSWYAYWNGLVASKSTGCQKLDGAIVAAENMVRSGGKKARVADAVLSDEEFEQIQRIHFGRKQDPAAQARSLKSLTTCLEAMRAFKGITGLQQIILAGADDCAAFQRKAQAMPKNWRQKYPQSRKSDAVARISSNTVLKWSRALQAAFERANRNAGRKCVRGVVPVAKLLSFNPWNQFVWIEGRERTLRQFDAEEIVSLLDFFETQWATVSVAVLLAKFFLWSSCRQQEATGLKWSSLKRIGTEIHFEIVGKWGVERWVRIPFGLFCDLEAIRTDSDYVFAAYNEQLRQHHQSKGRSDNARRVGPDFKPLCLGDWFADRIDDWSANLPKGHAHTHVFRKTSLQYVRSGEDLNRQVAKDARVSESVLMTSYVKETAEQLRQASNRTFARILASLPADLARRCGQMEAAGDVEERLRQAIEARDWQLAATLTVRLAKQTPIRAS
jgi:integrase